jgi:acyl carrier protein
MTPDHDAILDAIEEIVAGMKLPFERPFDRHLDFEELGLDSLAIAELVAGTELRYGLLIDDGDYRKIRSAEEFAIYLRERLS